MLHEKIAKQDGFNKVDIAALWPVGIQIAPLPLPDIGRPGNEEVFMSAPAAPDVPGAVGMMIVTAYAAMIAALAFTAGGSRDSNFMIAVSALFVLMYFTVPRIMLGMEPKSSTRPSFDHFMKHGMDTHTGHSSGKAALVQILLVPVFLTLAVLAMGITAAMIL